MQQPKTTSRKQMYFTLAALLAVFLYTGFLNYPKAWNVMAEGARKINLNIPNYWDVPFRLGLDLKGGASLVYDADLSQIPASGHAEALAGARDVIERRVNAFGVAEPLVEVATSGNVSRINVELAGVTDVEAAIKQIGETPILEFKTPKKADPSVQKKETADANKEVLKQAEDALAQAKRGVFTNDVKTEFVSKLTAEYSELVGQLETMKAYRGQTIAKVVETDKAYWVVKVVDTRKTEHEVQASHILICYKGAQSCSKETSKEDALAKIISLIPGLTKDNFGKTASENSTEPGAVSSAGSLGWFFPSTMVEPFAKAVNALKVGEITKTPVETAFGYHLIHKTGTHPNVLLPEYKLQVMKFMKTTAVISAEQEWDNTDLSGKDLKTAVVQFDSRTGEPQVSLTFTDEGGRKFADITKAWVGQQIAIFLDGSVISAPVVQQEITGGQAQITGRFTIEEAKILARRLNAGALPIPVKLVSQSTIGPTLGAVAVKQSVDAGIMGFLLVVLFMILYYRLPGLVASFALLFYVLLNLTVFKLLPVTITLSGVAGFVISIGMAVDANILIFERLREELKAGRSLLAAIDEGFKRAWSSIWDGNLTALIACVILFNFTSSTIKGFALTMGIGVVISMFSAITITRVLLRALVGLKLARHGVMYGPKLPPTV